MGEFWEIWGGLFVREAVSEGRGLGDPGVFGRVWGHLGEALWYLKGEGGSWGTVWVGKDEIRAGGQDME